MKNEGNLEAAQGNVILFKFLFFLVFFPFFIILIAFKSVQMIRDEIEDGTLLIFNSMPYTRVRIIVEKWMSLQIVCLFYSVIVISLPISFCYLVSQIIADTEVILNFKALFPSIDTIFLTSFIIQILLSTFAILLSLVLSTKAIIGLMCALGGVTFIGPIVPLILNGMNDNQTNSIFGNLNYVEKAIRESGLKKYIDDPETKKYFEFEGWDSHKTSIWEIQNHSFNFREIFIVKSDNDLGKEVEKLDSSVSNIDIINSLNYFHQNGIKLDDGNGIKLKNDTKIPPNVEEIYNKLKLNPQPLYLTSYIKKDHRDIKLFEEGSKLEKIWKIIIFNDHSFYDYLSVPLVDALRYSDLGINCNYIGCGSFNQNLEEMIKVGKIGTNYEKNGFANLPGLYINNPQYYGFLYFIKKLKNIVTSFRIPASTNGKSDIKQLNLKLERIKKNLKDFNLNNYLNLWSQWYMMWQGDFRSIGSNIGYSMFVIPNFKANFAISNETRTWDEGGTSELTEIKENFITVDTSSFKPIINMIGLYAWYLCISLVLAVAAICITIRKDFV